MVLWPCSTASISTKWTLGYMAVYLPSEGVALYQTVGQSPNLEDVTAFARYGK